MKDMRIFPCWRLDSIPEAASEYPEFHMFGELPSWGFYVRHVYGLVLKNVRLSVRDDDFRPAFVFDDVRNLTMEGGSVTSLSNNHQVILKDTENASINNLTIDGEELRMVPSYGENKDIKGVELLK